MFAARFLPAGQADFILMYGACPLFYGALRPSPHPLVQHIRDVVRGVSGRVTHLVRGPLYRAPGLCVLHRAGRHRGSDRARGQSGRDARYKRRHSHCFITRPFASSLRRMTGEKTEKFWRFLTKFL